MRRKITIALLALLAPTGCGGLRVPDPSPDGKAPAPANGVIEHPVRPKGIPDDFLAFTWIVEFEDRDGHPARGSADVEVHAESSAPVQGNVHGPYPYRIWTGTPYSHTIWYQPGVVIHTDVYAWARPELGLDDHNAGIELVCSGAMLGNFEPVDGVVMHRTIDPGVAHCSYTIE